MYTKMAIGRWHNAKWGSTKASPSRRSLSYSIILVRVWEWIWSIEGTLSHNEPCHECEACACVWVMVAVSLCAIQWSWFWIQMRAQKAIATNTGWLLLLKLIDSMFFSSHFLRKCQMNPHNEKWLFENWRKLRSRSRVITVLKRKCEWWKMVFGVRHPMTRDGKKKRKKTPPPPCRPSHVYNTRAHLPTHSHSANSLFRTTCDDVCDSLFLFMCTAIGCAAVRRLAWIAAIEWALCTSPNMMIYTCTRLLFGAVNTENDFARSPGKIFSCQRVESGGGDF